MLVLTRRKGESFRIGDEIEIVLLETQGDKAKIGITAPRALPVLRGELIDEATRLNREAAAAPVTLGDLARALGHLPGAKTDGKQE